MSTGNDADNRSTSSERCEVPLDDGHRMRAQLLLPDGARPRAGVVVLHDLFGFTPDVLRIGERLAAHGHAALVPDLYDGGRGGRAACVTRTLLAHTSGRGRTYRVIEQCREWLMQRTGVQGTALMGFCMGGRFAILAAARQPFDVVAPFYGSVPRRTEDVAGICPVVGGWGGRDLLDGRDGERLRAHLERLGVEHDIVTYPEAGHSYMNDHDTFFFRHVAPHSLYRAQYHEGAAEDSWRRVLAFFERIFAGDGEGETAARRSGG